MEKKIISQIYLIIEDVLKVNRTDFYCDFFCTEQLTHSESNSLNFFVMKHSKKKKNLKKISKTTKNIFSFGLVFRIA